MNKQDLYYLEIDVSSYEGPVDHGLWLGYGTIVTFGDSLQDCLDNAAIDLIDQDGGEYSDGPADADWMQDLIRETFHEKYRLTLVVNE